jgi:hypothetical protein
MQRFLRKSQRLTNRNPFRILSWHVDQTWESVHLCVGVSFSVVVRDEKEDIMEERAAQPVGTTSRRAFLGKTLAAGAGAIGATLVAEGLPGATLTAEASGGLTPGDAAILRFLAALETLETDFWQQYNELGGIQDSEVPGGSGSAPYTTALQNLDSDMAQYIHDNTDDEFTHFTFLNAYLMAHGAATVSLDQFRTLPGSQATGAQKNQKRLTNLMQLNVDTSWWTRYRSDSGNPDLGDSFPQAIPGLFDAQVPKQFPAIPRSDADLAGSTAKKPSAHLQAIANTAAFHFAMIEQGGTSLYPSLAQRVNNKEVLRILLSIGPSETMHFQTWQDKAGNAVAPPLAPLTDPTNGLTFPDLTSAGELFQPNLIMPEPTSFLSRSFPKVSIIRPTETTGAAMGALQFLTLTGLFVGQSQAFFTFMTQLAQAADAA